MSVGVVLGAHSSVPPRSEMRGPTRRFGLIPLDWGGGGGGGFNHVLTWVPQLLVAYVGKRTVEIVVYTPAYNL